MRFGQDLPVPTCSKRRVDAHLLGVEAHLLEAAGLDAAGFPVLEVHERTSPPQRQRLVRDECGMLRLTKGE